MVGRQGVTQDGPERDGDPSLGRLGEDAVVAAIIASLPPAPPWVRIGPGDDAAALDLAVLAAEQDGPGEPEPGLLLVSVDTLVEGHDFRLSWSSGADIGAKTAAQTLADIAAMGARPAALLVSLAAPAQLAAAVVADLGRGLAAECARAGAVLLGGDVSGAEQVVLTGTALGWTNGPVVRRDGARPGDLVALAGRTGASAAGLAMLESGVTAGDPAAVQQVLRAHRTPSPPYAAGPVAAAVGASALIDVSDGLLRDAARIAASSGVVIELEWARLPVAPELALVADVLEPGVDPRDRVRRWVLTGGEDHALLACLPPSTVLPAGYVEVGRVRAAGPDGSSVLVDGSPVEGPLGWLAW